VPADLEGTGTGPGDVFGNFTLVDQFGDDVELYQFYGQVVQIALVAEWCGICRDEAPDIDAVGAELIDDAAIITILMEDSAGRTPDAATAARWADELGVTGPVLAGPGDLNSSVRGGFPTLPLLDRDMVIVTDDNFPFSARAIEDVIAD
jgi:thiol-disulfide isomerase/thioredoxin